MRLPRKLILGPGSRFHKIWRAHNREYLLQPHTEKLHYLECLRDDIRAHRHAVSNASETHEPAPAAEDRAVDGFHLHSYCTMSNHVHETGRVGLHLMPFSEHMRRAHGRFGLGYNRRHKRIGKVACERPKTVHLQGDEALRRAMLYGDCNPVRAGLITQPTDIRWRGLSSCRFYALGETSALTSMLTPPDWYLALGRTPEQRQSRYRALLDQYLVAVGLKRDPKLSEGFFCGSSAWMLEMRRRLRDVLVRMGSRAAPAGGPAPPG